MPDGREFANISNYKRLLLEDKTAMPRALARLLLPYSLGRRTGFSDRSETDRIVDRIRSQNCGLRSLVHEVVQSKVFRSP
jgi:hypothetical protein